MQVSPEETAVMERIIRKEPEELAPIVVQMAKTQNRLFGAAADYLVTREFKCMATRDRVSLCSRRSRCML